MAGRSDASATHTARRAFRGRGQARSLCAGARAGTLLGAFAAAGLVLAACTAREPAQHGPQPAPTPSPSTESSMQTAEPEGIPCAPHFDDAGLPNRTAQIIARERGSYEGMAEAMLGGESAGKGTHAGEPAVTTAALHQAANSDDAIRRYAAAFLIGRCRAGDRDADARLTELAGRMLEPERGPDVAIEAAMSLVLRGQRARGQQYLQTAARSTDPFADAYKAAFFLAQLGDVSGYPALARTLQSEIPHYRVMALRHLLPFAAFDGQAVDGQKIDVHARLVERLHDSDALVRQEVPFYLEELARPGLEPLLEQVVASDPDENVRTAARMVLERLSPQ